MEIFLDCDLVGFTVGNGAQSASQLKAGETEWRLFSVILINNEWESGISSGQKQRSEPEYFHILLCEFRIYLN